MRNRRITAALLAACLAGTLAVPAQGEDAWQPQTVAVCEAEDGTFTGNVRVERKGSVTDFQDDGDSCTVIVQIDETGFMTWNSWSNPRAAMGEEIWEDEA